MFDYTAMDLRSAIANCGVSSGDTIFVHSNLGMFGRMDGGVTPELLCMDAVRVAREVIGLYGTVCVPCFSHTPCGMFSENVKSHPHAAISDDPMFTVATLGRQAKRLVANTGVESFGEDSFWDRFLVERGKIVNFNFDAGSTFIHFVERRLNVPYRSDRLIGGSIYFSRSLEDPLAVPRFERFDKLAREAGYVRTAKVGRGAVNVITASDTVRLIEDTIKREPYFLTERGVNV